MVSDTIRHVILNTKNGVIGEKVVGTQILLNPKSVLVTNWASNFQKSFVRNTEYVIFGYNHVKSPWAQVVVNTNNTFLQWACMIIFLMFFFQNNIMRILALVPTSFLCQPTTNKLWRPRSHGAYYKAGESILGSQVLKAEMKPSQNRLKHISPIPKKIKENW